MEYSLALPYRAKPIFKSFDEFAPIRKLGQGSFSVVLECIHNLSGRTYAIKKIDLSLLSEKDREMCSMEIRIHKNLNHKNIVRFIDFFYDDKNLYLVLEFCSRGTLLKQMGRRQLDLYEILKLFRQACAAIYYIHSNHILMRDIKPENMLYDSEQNIKICDFGWSSYVSDGDNNSQKAGTFEYMSPECLKNEVQSFPSDVWSLGVLLFELCTNEEPYNMKSTAGMLNMMARHRFNSDKIKNEDVKDLISKMLRYKPEERPTMLEVMTHKCFQVLFQSGYTDESPKYNAQLEKMKEEQAKLKAELEKKKNQDKFESVSQPQNKDNRKSETLQQNNELRIDITNRPVSNQYFSRGPETREPQTGLTLANQTFVKNESKFDLNDRIRIGNDQKQVSVENNKLRIYSSRPLLAKAENEMGNGNQLNDFNKTLVLESAKNIRVNESKGQLNQVPTVSSNYMSHDNRRTLANNNKTYLNNIKPEDMLRIKVLEEPQPEPKKEVQKQDVVKMYESPSMKQMPIPLDNKYNQAQIRQIPNKIEYHDNQDKVYNIYSKNLVSFGNHHQSLSRLTIENRLNQEKQRIEKLEKLDKLPFKFTTLENNQISLTSRPEYNDKKGTSFSPNPTRKLFKIDTSTNRYVNTADNQ